MANIKRNLMYSTLLTMSTYLVPLIVFPYISRILGVEGIGVVDTIDSLIDYCILFSMMGMSSVGIREIAKCKDNEQELSQTFTDLFALNLYSTLFIAVVFCGSVYFSPRLQDFGILIPISLLKLIANLFWVEWLYTGLEKFRYITIRSLMIRLIFIISVFLFIHSQTDVAVYYFLFVSITIGNAICNWYHKRSYLHWNLFRANVRRFLLPFFLLGCFAILSAIYTKLSLPVLNFLTNDHEAGNYATATRFYQVVIALIGTLTAVMIPRMSVLIKKRNFDLVREYSYNSFKILFLFAFPLIIFVELFAPDIIRFFTGNGFEGAILPMRIIILQLIVIGAEKIIVLQLLIPLRKDRTIIIAGIVGVLVWLALTISLVPLFHSIGTSIAWIASELTVLLITSQETRRSLSIDFPIWLFVKSCAFSIPYILLGLLVITWCEGPVLRILSSIVLFLTYATLLEFYIYKIGITKDILRLINSKKK